MLSSTDTIETTKRNSEVEFKEEIIEEIQKHVDKKVEAITAQQSKLIQEIQDWLKNHFLEQTTNKIGFPPNPKSQLKVLIKEEAKRQFEKNGFIKLNFKDFFNSAGLKKIIESHTIYQDKKRQQKYLLRIGRLKMLSEKLIGKSLQSEVKRFLWDGLPFSHILIFQILKNLNQ